MTADPERPFEDSAGALVPTPSQTAGPFLSIGTSWNAEGRVGGSVTGPGIALAGRVVDGAGDPVTDALLEFFQADPAGRFPPSTEKGWSGFARSLTDRLGRYELRTLKPGRLPVPGGTAEQAPHLEVSIFARGLQQRLVTRIYFADEEAANADDPTLALVGQERRRRLIADLDGDTYRFDVVLQGADESVFFMP